ncbi:MAG: PRC-barrel domain-containing protein [Methanomicrobiales archaeon]|jgi:sporulation protein YlmC with PRC-barrel domain|nr:PRC-barrel domain-containing protein [Methanomicrobiales archaeon]
MKPILTRTLAKKQIITNDGKVLGVLKNILVDAESGQITEIVLIPDPSFDVSGYQMDGERMLIPFESVRDIKDYIVVDRYLSRM